jgi:DNA helicase-2/ATP-dependent DNA helicase PcrA
VQVLTIHAAKGLEWDHVAVANLIEGDFPSSGQGSSGWLATGNLPFPLRGDSASLPVWNYKHHSAQPDVKKSIDEFKEEMRSHLLKEELRLMYVAVTRPKSGLLLTGSYWKPGNKGSRKPSQFLIAACEKLEVEIPDIDSEINPLEEIEVVESWPLDPLGERHRKDAERAAKATLSAIESLSEIDTLRHRVEAIIEGDQIQQDITLLLAEKEAALLENDRAHLPVRIPASSFKDYIGDFDSVIARLRRPMPQPPYKQTRTGTLFHSWVEGHFGAGNLIGQLQDLPESTDADGPSLENESIQELQKNFKGSRFAAMQPVEIEREIQLTIGANTFICKLDAVFETEKGFEIIDWKTGKAPKNAADQKLKVLQLALYRLAYSRFTGIPIDQIEVSFYFVAEDKEIKPMEIPNEAELLELWAEVSA